MAEKLNNRLMLKLLVIMAKEGGPKSVKEWTEILRNTHTLKKNKKDNKLYTGDLIDSGGYITEKAVRTTLNNLTYKNIRAVEKIEVEKRRYNYKITKEFQDIFNDPEKLVDWIINVVFDYKGLNFMAGQLEVIEPEMVGDISEIRMFVNNSRNYPCNPFDPFGIKNNRKSVVGKLEELAELKLDALSTPVIKTDVEIAAEYPWLNLEKFKHIEGLDDRLRKIKEWSKERDDVEVRQNARMLIELLQGIVISKSMISIFIYDREKDVFIYNESALEREVLAHRSNKEALYRFFYYQAVIDKVYGKDNGGDKLLYTFLKELYALHMIKDPQLREELYLYLLGSTPNRMLVALIHDPNTSSGINKRLEQKIGIKVDMWQLLSGWDSISREEKDELYLFLLGVVNFMKDKI